MNKITDIFLKNYGETNHLTRLKIQFTLWVCMLALVLIPVIIFFTIYIGMHSPFSAYHPSTLLLGAEASMILVLLLAIFLIYKGALSVASHVIILSMIALIWLVMAIDQSPPINRLNTITYIPVLLSITPLLITQRKETIIIYAISCIALLIGFVCLFQSQLGLSNFALRIFIVYNGLAIVFMSFVAYYIFTIHQEIVYRSQWEHNGRQQAENELSFKNALLEAQSEALPDGILLLDNEGYIISYNRRFVDLFQSTPGDYGAKPDEDFIRALHNGLTEPEKFQQTLDYLKEHPEASIFTEADFVNGRKMECNTGPVCGQKGDCQGRVWHLRDITSQKQIEADLRASEERYRCIVEDQNEMILRLKPNGKVTFVNGAFIRLYREKLNYQDDLVNTNVIDLMQNKNIGSIIKKLTKLTPEKPLLELERSFTAIDGQSYWIVWNVRARFDDSAAAIEYLMVGRDITEKMRSEIELRNRTAQYEQLASTIPSIFWQVDTDSELNLSKIFFSKDLKEFLGFPLAQINYNLPVLFSYIHPEDLPQIIKNFKKLVHSPGQKGFCEYRIRDANGVYHWLYTIGASSINEDGVIQIFGITEDIGERKSAEQEKNLLQEQLRQSQKMESIGRLAGGIAHDFNNLLTAISGNIDLALLNQEENSLAQKRLLAAGAAAESAAALTQQLLAFSRKQVIEPRILNLNDLIGQMSKLIGRVIGEDIEFHARISEPVGTIKADQGQIEQILLNLVVNARDAMPEGGKLCIETSDVMLDEYYCRNHANAQPGCYVLLSVSDTGMGMNDEVKQHLFEPFYTTKPQGKGTGLGLATVYGAVMQHDGFIDVCSSTGQGSTFNLYFPYISGEVEQKYYHESMENLPQGSETILVVEDETPVLEIAQDILTHLGYTVIGFTTAEEALTQTEDVLHTIPLLLTDIILPGMNGRTLADEMTARHPQIKILFTSGYTEEVIARHGMLDDGTQFIGKPYAAGDLAHKVRAILDSSCTTRLDAV